MKKLSAVRGRLSVNCGSLHLLEKVGKTRNRKMEQEFSRKSFRYPCRKRRLKTQPTRTFFWPRTVSVAIFLRNNYYNKEIIQVWNEVNPKCKPTDETYGLLLFFAMFHCNNMQAKDLCHFRLLDIYNATINVSIELMVWNKPTKVDNIWFIINYRL